MTPEELDEARAKEAQRLWESGQEAGSSSWVVAARLAREGWTPPEPVVDPDVLAWREWMASRIPSDAGKYLSGRHDFSPTATAFLAGARMAREREQERAKPLAYYVREHRYSDPQADRIYAKYHRGEA